MVPPSDEGALNSQLSGITMDLHRSDLRYFNCLIGSLLSLMTQWPSTFVFSKCTFFSFINLGSSLCSSNSICVNYCLVLVLLLVLVSLEQCIEVFGGVVRRRWQWQ